MKKTIIILSLFAIAFKSNSQSNDSLSLCYDEMTEQYKPICRDLIISVNEDKTKAFELMVLLKYEDGIVKYNGLGTKTIGIGTCVEKDRLIIMFADGTKYSSISWSDFDCDGFSFYDIDAKDRKLIDKKITSIMFINGRSYDSYKFNVTEAYSDYLQKIFKAIDNKMYKLVNCN